jgi:hypothetical protein
MHYTRSYIAKQQMYKMYRMLPYTVYCRDPQMTLHTAVGIRLIYSSKIIGAFQHRRVGGFLRIQLPDLILCWCHNSKVRIPIIYISVQLQTQCLILHNTFFFIYVLYANSIHLSAIIATVLKVLSSHLNWGARLDSFDPLLNSR